MKQSIQRKLPLFVTTLLLAVTIAQLTIGYGEVRQTSGALSDKRLQLADSVLAALLQTSQQRARVTALAKDSAIVAFLRSGGQRGRAEALAAMARITNDTVTNASLELRDFSGRLLLRTGRFTLADSVLVSPGTDSARFGPLLRRDTLLYFGVAAASGHAEQDGGIVQQVARLQLNERTRRTLTGLAGGDVSLLFGNADGDPWTDFATIVPTPPARVRTSGTAMRYERGEMKRGIAKAVLGTPWMVVAELPSRVILAPARGYLLNMAPIAVLIVLVGALAAWWGSRRITTPLQHLTTAAEGIAGGDMRPRVRIAGEDELGRLARSFNAMAERVADAQHRLEGQVAERTRAFQQSEARLRSVTETAHDAIIAADAEGTIRYWNPGATRIFGYAAEAVIGKPLTMLMPDRFRDLHKQGIRRYVETREAHVVGRTVELEGRRKDGTEFPLELSLAAGPADEEVGGALTFTGVIRDITERKRIEAALQATNTELESFSYSVSHDLRAPLRAIHGFARILLEDHNAQLEPEAQRLLGVIDQNTRRMGQLIDDLLAFSRLGRTDIATGPVDMKELTQNVADEIQRADVARQGSLEIRIDPLPPTRGDRGLLRQVMSNLLQNAVKFTRDRPSARIEVGARPDGGQTVYYVKDNGAGFDARYADKLFGVFQRLHSTEQFDGTGVGLAIVKRIVQRHGGRVWAEGKVDEGATFYFTLPGEER